MRSRLFVLSLCLALPGAASSLEQPFESLSLAYEAAAGPARAAAQVRRFTLEYGARGNRWTLRPDTTPPGSALTIWVEQGDRVLLEFEKRPFSRDTSVDIDGLEAEVDGQLVQGVHLDFRGASHEVRRVAFTAKKEGMILLYNRWSGAGHWGMIIVRKRKA